MAAAMDSGWAQRSTRLEREGAGERAAASRTGRRGPERPALAAISNHVDLDEDSGMVEPCAGTDEVSHDQVMRAAVNDLQHRLLLLDPQTDVYGVALARLMRAAGADRVCALLKDNDGDGQRQFGLYAEAVVSPELSLIASGAGKPEALGAFAPGLLDRLAAGEPFASMSEFLPGRIATRLADQGVEAILLLPLFVGGDFSGLLRLDRCDRAKLWSEDETSVLVSAAGSISAAIERQQVVAKVVQRSHELTALLTTSRAITSSIDYDIVLHEVASAAAGALVCPQCVIWEYSGRSDVATYRVCYLGDRSPEAAEDLVGEVLWASDYPGGMRAVRDGIVAEQSLSDEDLSSKDRALMTQRGEKTRLSVPLVYREEVLGMMILVETERQRSFTPDEVRMARVIGEQAAAALHNARLHRREEDQHRWLAALAEATRVIGSRLNRVELLRDVAGLATKALLLDQALVYEWADHDAVFALRAADGGLITVQDLADADAAIEDTVTALLRRGESVIQQRSDECLAARTVARMMRTGEQAIAWVPFRMKDEILGAMRLSACSKDRTFGEDELSFARALGEHAAIALNNARLYAQIEHLAMMDGLTGLANHRCFYDRLAEEIERGRRCGTSVALIMLDIDDFKTLNDTYGHPAGDEVLRLIGALMTEECRKGGDLGARYGGEEFCVILPDTSDRQVPCRGVDDARAEPGSGLDLAADDVRAAEGHREGAAAVAERLRQRIAATAFPVGPDHAAVTVTVSIGIASFPDTAASMDELVACADAALYAAKRAGKDRVRVY